VKIWITGGKGMLGTDLAAAVAWRGHDVVVTDKELDISDVDALRAFAEQNAPTHLLNCAAHTNVDACETEKDLAQKINVDGAFALGVIAKEKGIHAVHVSTDYVFDGAGQKPYLEDDAKGPLNVYGKTKLDGEERFLEATGREGTIVRTSWLFGVHGKSFPGTMLKLMAEKEELKVVSDQVGRPTYPADFARALVDVAERKLSGVWHFANAGETSWHGFAAAILEHAKAKGMPLKCKNVVAIKAVEYPTPAKRPAYSVLSTANIERALGRAPRAWAQALDQYLDLTKTRGA